jgi:GT2 family glycosyltransferase
MTQDRWLIEPSGPPSAVTALEPGLTVAVCTYRRAGALLRFIESLRRQSRLPEYLIVADGSPDDATEDALRRDGGRGASTCGVLYVRAAPEARGLTRQRNLALERTPTQLVAFFDDDVVLDPRCLEEMERVHRELGDAVVGVGAVINGQDEPFGGLWRLRRALGIVSDLRPGRYHRSGMSTPWQWEGPRPQWAEGDWLPGGATMWRTAAAREVGFWPGFGGYAQGEDLEFSLRVRSRGRLVMAGAARVDHRHEAGGRPDDYRMGYMALYNRYQIHRRGLRPRRWRDVAWFTYAWTIDTLLLARHLLRGRYAAAATRQVAGRLAAAFDILRGR